MPNNEYPCRIKKQSKEAVLISEGRLIMREYGTKNGHGIIIKIIASHPRGCEVTNALSRPDYNLSFVQRLSFLTIEGSTVVTILGDGGFLLQAPLPQ